MIHKATRFVFASTLTAVLACAASARGQTAPDPALDATQRIILRMFEDSRDGRLIHTTLRSSREAAFLPLYKKMLETTQDPARQLEARMSLAIVSKTEAAALDIDKVLEVKNDALVGSALATLIENERITDAQLEVAAAKARDAAQRTLALGELDHRGVLKDRAALKKLLEGNAERDVVKYYTAVTLTESKDAAEQALGVATLRELSADVRRGARDVQVLMLLRIRKDKVLAAMPWAEDLARDAKSDDLVRYTAVATLLSLKQPAGATILADLIAKQKETIQQIQLGMLAVEFADQLKPEQLKPLADSPKATAKNLGAIAIKGTTPGADNLPELLKVLQDGHPIVLNWALDYADTLDVSKPDQKARQLALWDAIIRQGVIVDEQRRDDYYRAAKAAQKAADAGTDKDRELLTTLLKTENRATVEAVALGILRSEKPHLAELVLPLWTPAFYRKSSNDRAATFIALILGREGRQEPRAFLGEIVQISEDRGFAALAGWYYAKLGGQGDAVIDQVLKAAK